jgi:transketolase
MAIAEAQLAARYNRPGFEVIDHATFAIVSDGDLMEGVAAEAASLAGHLRLGKLICLYDDNYVTLSAGTDITFSEDRARRFEAYGWHNRTAFLIPEPALAHFREALARGARDEAWNERMAAYAKAFPPLAEELRRSLRGELPSSWDADIPVFSADPKGIATRVASGKVMNAIAPPRPALTGGSADLDSSTHTALNGFGDFNPLAGNDVDTQGSDSGGWSYAGRNVHFGVREHAMGAIVNGMAAHGGTVPYGSTFLIFSDYMRPAIRLAALMGLHVVHVFTHDSIALGEDDPTHQPVEQLAALRAIPNLMVIRPGDANETAVAWRVALETHGRPVVLLLTR